MSGEAVTDLAGARDPVFLARRLPVLDRVLACFDPVVEGWERLPADGPFVLVGNPGAAMTAAPWSSHT